MMANKVNSNQMTNTHILVNEFDYVQPNSLNDAIALLNQYGDQAQVIAGGTHLLTMLKMEREQPDVLVDISRIRELDTIRRHKNGELEIGSITKIRAIYNHPYIQENYPALVEACSSFGSTQIQNMATIGGNLCNGSPASDTVPSLFIYEAELVIMGYQTFRRIPVHEFLIGPGKTALQKGEILISIILPPPVPHASSAFFKISRVAADLAKASLAIHLVRSGNTIQSCRLALGSVAPTVIRIQQAEDFLKGKEFDDNVAGEMGEIVANTISPIDDIRSTAWYRCQVAKVMAQDALNSIWKSSPGKKDRNQTQELSEDFGEIPQTIAPRYIPVATEQKIDFTVNGIKRQLWVKSNELLLNTLRERLQLTGTKYGCGLGECSACTVLVDGHPMLSCLLLSASVNGKSITTIEGLQKPGGELDPLQESIIVNAAYQCGYCTPGLLMTVKGMLNEIPHPYEPEIRDYLKGNRCRCTGYISIVRAILDVVEPVGMDKNE
jgi:xanthine dehydrogenase iron-sulfur cluster and FAD-binding subunit A